MSLPINIVEFKSSFESLQNLVATDVLNLCSKELSLTSCSDIIAYPINYNDVLLIPSFPLILENGSLILRMFINYSVITGTQKEERFVNSSILHRIWNSPSTNLNLFIDNIRRIYPKKLNFNLITTNQPTTSTKVIIKSLSTTESNQPTQIIQTNLPLKTTNQILSSQTFQQNNFSETIGNSSVSSLTTTKKASLSNKCDFTSIFILSSILLENFT